MPKPKRKVIKRVVKVKSSGAGKKKADEDAKKSEDTKGGDENAKKNGDLNVVKSSGVKVDVGKGQRHEEKNVVTPPMTVAEVQKDDKESKEEKTVTPPVAEVQKDDKESKEEKKVTSPVAEVPKDDKESNEEKKETPQVAEVQKDAKEPMEEKTLVKSSGAKKDENETPIPTGPPVERHTTKENIKVFFNPETYQNKKDSPEVTSTPIDTVLDPTQDGAIEEPNVVDPPAVELAPTPVVTTGGMENTNNLDGSGEDSKKDDGSTKASDESGNGSADENTKPEEVEPETETPDFLNVEDSSWWDWKSWSTWNSWSWDWDRQWWGWDDQQHQKTWSCQTSPESGTPSSQSLEASLGRLNTVDLETPRNVPATPAETKEKTEPKKESPEEKKSPEEKDKAKKAAHARYMRYYRSVHESQTLI